MLTHWTEFESVNSTVLSWIWRALFASYKGLSDQALQRRYWHTIVQYENDLKCCTNLFSHFLPGWHSLRSLVTNYAFITLLSLCPHGLDSSSWRKIMLLISVECLVVLQIQWLTFALVTFVGELISGLYISSPYWENWNELYIQGVCKRKKKKTSCRNLVRLHITVASMLFLIPNQELSWCRHIIVVP